MNPDGIVSFAAAENRTQVADALAESSLAIERADWNSIEAEDLVQLLDARRTISGLALKYRQNASEAADSIDGTAADPTEVIADVLRFLWGRNPQAPVRELTTDQLLVKLVRAYGKEVVADAVDRAHWDVDVPDVEVPDGSA